jgi:hypothetical protein
MNFWPQFIVEPQLSVGCFGGNGGVKSDSSWIRQLKEPSIAPVLLQLWFYGSLRYIAP